MTCSIATAAAGGDHDTSPEAIMTTLWDTTGTDVVKALAAERRGAGAVAAGLALTMIAVVDEKHVAEAEQAAAAAAAMHPCRLLVVVRRQLDADSRLDAEVQVGGRLGPGEAVVMRMYGRLALHAESVVLPLLASDTPVVTWWHGEPPRLIAHDPLGVLAGRRVTDCSRAADPVAALGNRAADFTIGDTDLTWTRLTGWRGLLASTFDSSAAKAIAGRVAAESGNASAALMAGWLRNRLGIDTEVSESAGPGLTEVQVDFDNGDHIWVERGDGRNATVHRDGMPDRNLPLPRRDPGDLLAEELHRLDPDHIYGDALGTATGQRGLNRRDTVRVHEWLDPASPQAADEEPGLFGPAVQRPGASAQRGAERVDG
ncbi:MAG: glucose-6-phosphate dehydrogenase assembly protein OpcA [Pseudonocardiales bacterium]